MAGIVWPWQLWKKVQRLRKKVARLERENRDQQLSIEGYERGKKARDEALQAANLRVHDLECEVNWLREQTETGAMAIVVNKENLEEFLKALQGLKKGGE